MRNYIFLFVGFFILGVVGLCMERYALSALNFAFSIIYWAIIADKIS